MREGYNLIAGINTISQGEMEIDVRGVNSYVVTSLDYLLDNTDELLRIASVQRQLRDSQSLKEE